MEKIVQIKLQERKLLQIFITYFHWFRLITLKNAERACFRNQIDQLV